MNLAGLFSYGNKSVKSERTNTGRTLSTPSGNQLPKAVRNLSPGQSLQGEVVGKNGNEVQIRVNKDVVITAKMDADMNVSVGQNLTFEVKGNSGAQITLRPLYENLAQDANVLKALEAAKLPATNELMRMVSSMMERGMPIDRNALVEMGKLVMNHAGTDPAVIVTMKNFQIPITPENIEQFGNYQRYEHQILNTVTDILMEIPDAFLAMVNAGDGNAAIDFYTQILQLFTGSPAGLPEQAGENVNGMAPEGRVFADISEDNENPPALASPPKENGQNPKADPLQNVSMKAEEVITKEQGKLVGEAGENRPETTEEPNGKPYSPALGEALDGNGRQQLAAALGRLGFTPEKLQQIRSGQISVDQFLKEIQNVLSEKGNEVSKADLLHLFGSKEYNQVLNRQIQQQWLLRPEEVADKKEVKDLYDRLRQQTGRLMDALGQAAKDTPLAKSLTTMQNNIDFMNQINQMFHYIQLPLKMSGGNAHGDLYVYTNRRNTRKEDGSVSALLHLDMEYLGPLDVYVMMKETNVKTQFYLRDESMIDFIADHIHILNERLEKRGYSFHAEMKVKEEEHGKADVMERIAARERKTTLLSQYAFDVRA